MLVIELMLAVRAERRRDGGDGDVCHDVSRMDRVRYMAAGMAEELVGSDGMKGWICSCAWCRVSSWLRRAW